MGWQSAAGMSSTWCSNPDASQCQRWFKSFQVFLFLKSLQQINDPPHLFLWLFADLSSHITSYPPISFPFNLSILPFVPAPILFPLHVVFYLFIHNCFFWFRSLITIPVLYTRPLSVIKWQIKTFSLILYLSFFMSTEQTQAQDQMKAGVFQLLFIPSLYG